MNLDVFDTRDILGVIEKQTLSNLLNKFMDFLFGTFLF